MSLKDDFLEALRSVKRDFLKDYDDLGDNRPAPPPEPPVSQAAPPSQTPLSADAPPAFGSFSGDEVADSPPYDHHSMRDQFQPELHTPSDPGTPDSDEPQQVIASSAAEQEEDVGGYPEFDPDNLLSDEDLDDEDELPQEGGRFSMDTFEDEDSLGDERTVISKNTVIRGALQTDDSVRMFGQVLGDIDCRSNILVAGKIRGNTSAANAYIINAQVDGNLLCDDVINVTDDAWILGNVRAQQADIDGKIKGNIEIRHSISIGSNSSVIGNISTDELEIRRGAFVNGQIMMYSPSRDVIDKFDQFDS